MTKEFTAEDLLANLDDEQRAAAESLIGPTCILAGAGTGKTRTITHRIAYGIAKGYYAANRVLALTYTNRAAGELRSRLRSLGASGVQVKTFHAASLSQLEFFWPQFAGVRHRRLLNLKPS
jgi:DNA helicase-2/ATP-dependent DNA helicase PcrA